MKNKVLNTKPFKIKIDEVVIDNDNIKVYFCNDDIYYCYHKPDKIAGLKDVKQLFEAYLKKTKSTGKLFKVIVELAPNASITSDAREFLESHKEKALCEAIIIYNLAQRLIINFYFKIKSHQHPSKIFGDKESAIAWVNTF